jgi:hypothetical protein
MITESEHLSQIAAYYLGENTALRGKVVELEAEVERLKATCATERQTAISICIEVVDQYRRRFDRRSEFCAFDILSSAEGMLEKLLRGQLPTHTWQQERAAVVAWLHDDDPESESVLVSHGIESGEHWPEGGTSQ